MPDPILLRQLQEAALSTIALAQDEVQALFDCSEDAPSDATQLLQELFWYLSERSRTVSFLVSWNCAWDAEIVLRSFYETVAKILFISFAQEDQKALLVREYREVLGRANDQKQARKAGFAETLTRNMGNHDASRVFAALQDSRLFDLVAKETKSQRKLIEQKWSFSEIVEALDRQADAEKPTRGIKALLHMYGMASHLIHADNSALDLMKDRALRDPTERKILEAGHDARIISDQVSLWYLSADALRRHFKSEFQQGSALYIAYKNTTDLSTPFLDLFYKSQQEFYDDLRGGVGDLP